MWCVCFGGRGAETAESWPDLLPVLFPSASNRGCTWEEMGGGTDSKLRARDDFEDINVTPSLPTQRRGLQEDKDECRSHPVPGRQGEAWVTINEIPPNALEIARERDLGARDRWFQVRRFCALGFSHQQPLVDSA